MRIKKKLFILIPNDCFEKLKYYLENKNYELVAKKVKKKTYEIANAKRVTQFMLELLFKDDKSNNFG